MEKKGSSKSLSSPRRMEKFPPPLMRFLRSNVGSKSSRGRSIRASPMFMRSKNKDNIIVQTTQEPSSPKVTCIGQVRVRRTSNSIGKIRKQQRRRGGKEEKQEGPPCCCKIVKLQGLKKWVCCFQLGRKVESAGTTTTNRIFEESERRDGYVDSNSNSNSNPPKNALSLTRCRSAPYRSSSLASKFWGSPDNNIREPEEAEEQPPPPLPILEKEKPIAPEAVIGGLDSKKSSETEEIQSSSINDEIVKVHPLLLTRCKSEPARTGERLNPIRFSDINPPS